MSTTIAIKDLLEAGAHFGHQTRRWNPKMKPYIFGSRNGIYILDLRKTLQNFTHAADAVQELGRQGRTIMFVGTKRQAKDVIEAEAQRCGMPFVTFRWPGGMLTNFHTIRKSVALLKDLDGLETNPRFANLTKKERLSLAKDREKLMKVLVGVRNMTRLPDAVFVIDPSKEHIAVEEATKLNIPIIALVDTNCDPDLITHVIPTNDDAIRAIKLFASHLADAYLAGKGMTKDVQRQRDVAPVPPMPPAAPAAPVAAGSDEARASS